MPLDMHLDREALDLAELYGDADLPGYDRYQAESEIASYLQGLRTRDAQRRWLSEIVRPFGFYVASLPNWRAPLYGVTQ